MFIPMLRSIVREQALRVVDHKGCSHLVGDGTAVATIRLRAKWLEYRLALNPALALGEAYMEGLLVVEDGKLYEFLEVLARNYGKLGTNPWLSLAERLGRRLRRFSEDVTGKNGDGAGAGAGMMGEGACSYC